MSTPDTISIGIVSMLVLVVFETLFDMAWQHDRDDAAIHQLAESCPFEGPETPFANANTIIDLWDMRAQCKHDPSFRAYYEHAARTRCIVLHAPNRAQVDACLSLRMEWMDKAKTLKERMGE